MQCDRPELLPAARHRGDSLPLYSHLIGNQSVDSASLPLPSRPRRIVSGPAIINCYGAGGGVKRPFGGTKRSGHGRGKGWMALAEFSTTKSIVNCYA